MIQIAGGILIALAVICLLLVILAIALWYLGRLIATPDMTPEQIEKQKQDKQSLRRTQMRILGYTALGIGVYVFLVLGIVVYYTH